MKTFNYTQKQQILTQVQTHYEQDEIIQGIYWENGKGCAVGCISHSSSHEKVSEMLGVPLWMSQLIDTLFEGLQNGDAKEFPLRFVKAIPEDIDTEKLDVIRHKLALFQLNEICKNTDHETVKDAIDKVKSLHQRVIDGDTVTQDEWSATRSAAESATRSAVWSAESAARSAAESATRSEWSAAWSARSAAESATRSEWSAAWSARSAAESAAYQKMADKLIELLENTK